MNGILNGQSECIGSYHLCLAAVRRNEQRRQLGCPLSDRCETANVLYIYLNKTSLQIII